MKLFIGKLGFVKAGTGCFFLDSETSTMVKKGSLEKDQYGLILKISNKKFWMHPQDFDVNRTYALMLFDKHPYWVQQRDIELNVNIS